MQRTEWQVALANEKYPDEVDEVLTGLTKKQAIKEYQKANAIELRKVTFIAKNKEDFDAWIGNRLEEIVESKKSKKRQKGLKKI